MAKKKRNEIVPACKEMNLYSYTDYRHFLKDLFGKIRSGDSSYTLSRFSSDLSFQDAGFIGTVLNGRRGLNSKTSAKIARVLEIHGNDRRFFNAMIKYCNTPEVSEREKHFASMMNYKGKATKGLLDNYLQKYFSEWYNPIIREMVGLAGFNGNPEWIRERLNFPLSLKKIKESLKLLEQLDVIKKSPGGSGYERSRERIVTDRDVDNLNMIRCHQKNLDMAKEAITRIHYEKREIRSITLCLPEKIIPEIKDQIYKWMVGIMDMDDGAAAGSEVYQLNVQFFPYTEKEDPKDTR